MFEEEQQDARDLTRAVLARARSRIAVSLADDAYRGALWSVLRTELGESVTRMSAFVLAVLECENLAMDDLAWMIEPASGWPHRLHRRRLAKVRSTRFGGAVADVAREGGDQLRRHGLSFHARDGGHLRLHVVDESIEIAGNVGQVGVRSRFGALWLTIPGALPASLVPQCIGLPAESLVDLPALIGRDWPVVGLRPSTRSDAWTVIVRAGSTSYTMPWAR